MTDANDLVSINDATRITGLEKATLYRLAQSGRIRSFKVLGTALRFDRADLRALVVERPARLHDVTQTAPVGA
jgi:excisionase family DNA binding protein